METKPLVLVKGDELEMPGNLILVKKD